MDNATTFEIGRACNSDTYNSPQLGATNIETPFANPLSIAQDINDCAENKLHQSEQCRRCFPNMSGLSREGSRALCPARPP
jgi:hypothetical protein